MDCRTFHRNLEDYLEDGLDFAGRFGMERHAQQCITCGKEMAGAQRLRQMASEIERVKAPLNFESSLIDAIGKRKLDGRFPGIWRFWTYGLVWPSWGKLALVSSSLVVLGLGIFFALRMEPPGQPTVPSSDADNSYDLNINEVGTTNNVGESVDFSPSKERITADVPKAVEAPQPPRIPEPEFLPDQDATDSEYAEFRVMGSDGRPVTIRLPRKIKMQYGGTSEEYFIRNISH
jgi:hypothetical protein